MIPESQRRRGDRRVEHRRLDDKIPFSLGVTVCLCEDVMPLPPSMVMAGARPSCRRRGTGTISPTLCYKAVCLVHSAQITTSFEIARKQDWVAITAVALANTALNGLTELVLPLVARGAASATAVSVASTVFFAEALVPAGEAGFAGAARVTDGVASARASACLRVRTPGGRPEVVAIRAVAQGFATPRHRPLLGGLQTSRAAAAVGSRLAEVRPVRLVRPDDGSRNFQAISGVPRVAGARAVAREAANLCAISAIAARAPGV